ncbi:LPS export ABC transporter periplasmic protein LptC [Alteromonas lipolytica]|uniref:Lipopolysaccharide export system protein LptC n=1 Tax=Alteromonas lipolytica TaxID=1856405 RepID=A0A1E8FDY2_9ALTE|nr:LPS export ABC transporter periplasmic protein LptC [Alteromonas lipolytica]OFI33798.1 LPS export ABC transporter periplasmic protein LptC [Alteromonas lipolytica]GGF68280.1 lipopolysaccharide export system protein LptC [Alteromonas lipolytica]
MNKVGLSIASLFILASLLYIPTFMSEEPLITPDEDILAITPSYKARNLTTTLYNESGQRVHQVFSSTMENYEQLGFVLFSAPQYTIYQESGEPPWQVVADEGTLYDNNMIQLENNVIIVSENQADFVQRVTTDYLEIDLDEQTMVSDANVEISGPDFLILSNGLRANLLNKTYELNQHVQTTYSPAN